MCCVWLRSFRGHDMDCSRYCHGITQQHKWFFCKQTLTDQYEFPHVASGHSDSMTAWDCATCRNSHPSRDSVFSCTVRRFRRQGKACLDKACRIMLSRQCKHERAGSNKLLHQTKRDAHTAARFECTSVCEVATALDQGFSNAAASGPTITAKLKFLYFHVLFGLLNKY